MKRLLTVLALLALAAGTAFGAEYVKGQKYTGKSGSASGGYNYGDSLYYPLQVNSNGVLSVLDSQANSVTTTNLINRVMLSTTLADSNSTPVSVVGAARLALIVRITGDSLSVAPTIFVQVRAHTSASSDSNSTAAWLRPRAVTTNALADTALTFDYSLRQGVLVPSSSEFKVIGAEAAGGAGNPGGGSPRAIIIPIANNLSGDFFPAEYLSVRVRPGGGIRSRYRLKVDLVQFNR